MAGEVIIDHIVVVEKPVPRRDVLPYRLLPGVLRNRVRGTVYREESRSPILTARGGEIAASVERHVSRNSRKRVKVIPVPRRR